MALTKITPQMFDTSAAGHDFNIDNGTFVVDASANRVGIGTASPSNTLDVVGGFNLSGNIFVDTNVLTTDVTNNRVGIGTASPTAKLHVYDGGITIQSPSGSGGHYFSLDNTDTGGRHYAFISTSNAHGSLGGGDFALLDFDVSGNDAARTRLLVDSSGNIGIGTTAPSTEFHVKGAGTVATFEGTGGSGFITMVDSDDSTQAFIGVDAGTLKFQTSSSSYSDKLVITPAGLVGIGRTPAFASLEVEGDKTLANNLQLQLNGATNTNKQMILGFDTSTDESHIISQIAGSALKPLILSASRVGIGASSMTATRPFHVKTGFNATGAIGATFENTDTNGSSWLQLAGNGTAGSFQIGASGGQFRLYNDTTSTHIFDISGTGAVTATGLASSGDVIVTKSSAKVEATESSGASVRMIAGGSTGYIGNYSNHTLQILTNSSPRVYIDNTGKVGIGDATPQALLDVGGGYGGNTTVATFAHATDAYIEIENMTTQNGAGIILTNAGTKKWTIQKDTSAHGLYIQDGSTNPNMTFLQGGNVGIGTTSPSEELHVNSAVSGQHSRVHITKTSTAGTAGVSMRSNSASNTWTMFQEDASASDLYFYDGANYVLTLDSTNNVAVAPNFLASRTFTRGDGGAPAYSLTMSADNGGNAIEIFRTNNSKMLQYMSADGKYYFDMYGSSTPEIIFRNAGTSWMKTQGTRLYVGGSSTQTLGAGGSAAGGAANQTILQVQGAVDLGYQGRYTHGLWGPSTVSNTGAYTHLRTAMWGGGSPHGNSEYIMGGFIITGYRYQGTANHRSLHQFHNWSGSLYNYTADNLIDGGGWTGAAHVYVDSTGYVTIRLASQSSNYRMFYVEYIQYSQYNKVATEITAVTVSNSLTI